MKREKRCLLIIGGILQGNYGSRRKGLRKKRCMRIFLGVWRIDGSYDYDKANSFGIVIRNKNSILP